MDPIQILRPDDLASLLGVAKMTIFRMEQRGELPARKKISKRCVGWKYSTIEKFIDSRPPADPATARKFNQQ